MDWIIWAFNILLIPYTLYGWRKYSDKEFLYFFWIVCTAVILLSIKLFFINWFSEEIKQIINFISLLGWASIIIAVFAPEIIKKRK